MFAKVTMKILARALVMLTLLSLGLGQGNGQSKDQLSLSTSTSTKKIRREMQEPRLKTLFNKVGVSVAVESDAKIDQPQTYREFKFRWAATVSSSETGSSLGAEQERTSNISVVEDKKGFGTLPRRRSLELSATQVVIAAVDNKNQLRWWSIVADPRIVRSEFQTATGDLLRKDYYLSNTTLVVAFPDDPQIVELRFYHPFWTGSEFNLMLLASAPVQ